MQTLGYVRAQEMLLRPKKRRNYELTLFLKKPFEVVLKKYKPFWKIRIVDIQILKRSKINSHNCCKCVHTHDKLVKITSKLLIALCSCLYIINKDYFLYFVFTKSKKYKAIFLDQL